MLQQSNVDKNFRRRLNSKCAPLSLVSLSNV